MPTTSGGVMLKNVIGNKQTTILFMSKDQSFSHPAEVVGPTALETLATLPPIIGFRAMNREPAITYTSYLQVDALLSLQQPRSVGPEHDEMLFIVIHQVYELWFKELLHEVDFVRRLFEEDESHRAQHTLKRILTILKVLVAQLDILETMTPLEFLSFRERLEAASGFQSDQFRQLEFVLGRKSAGVVERFPEASRGRRALEERYRQPTLWDAFLHYLAREGYPVSPDQLTRDVTAP